ncbi:MAG: hypothetical protein GC192_05860 [Bacteroidetes bacterium]|nr:hypothetical protein [Bacteroidota bacterium]
MAVIDLNNQHFSPEDRTAINDSLAAIEAIVAPYSRNLTRAQRQKYGSINEKNKLLVNKVNDYHSNQPALDCPDTDWTEFTNDMLDRKFIEGTNLRLNTLTYTLESIKIMHDYDNYQAALLENKYTTYKLSTPNGSDWQTKHEELQQFFPNTGGHNNNEEEEGGEEEGEGTDGQAT